MAQFTAKMAPAVTERKYLDYRWQGDSFFSNLGFKIQRSATLEIQEVSRETPKNVITETHYDQFVMIEGKWVYSCSTIITGREKKQLCVGGPLGGQFKAGSQAPEYTAFNNAYNRGSSDLKTVLIWNQLLTVQGNVKK